MEIVVQLPEAHSVDYLGWMAFWREVEVAVLKNPARKAVASLDTAPLLRGKVARALSDIVRDLAQQALSAGDRGVPCAPRLLVPDQMLAPIIHHHEARGGWLIKHAANIGVTPLAPHLVELRARVLAALASAMKQSRLSA